VQPHLQALVLANEAVTDANIAIVAFDGLSTALRAKGGLDDMAVSSSLTDFLS
jgi:hypothetical protein